MEVHFNEDEVATGESEGETDAADTLQSTYLCNKLDVGTFKNPTRTPRVPCASKEFFNQNNGQFAQPPKRRIE